MRNKTQFLVVISGILLSIFGVWLSIHSIQTATVTASPTDIESLTPTAPSPVACGNTSLYGFESGEMGWKPQSYEGSQAVQQVRQSTDQAKSGISSLELQLELNSQNDNRATGETFVDLRYDPPAGLKAPLDLEGVPITIWIYAPGAVAGKRETPNGVQVFVKDRNFKSEYGTWFNLTNGTDRWIPITLTPTKDPPSSGEMQPEFDPGQIILIGIKVETGKEAATTYIGPMWIDDICWEMP